MDVKFTCTKENFKNYDYSGVVEFDTYNCFEKMREFCQNYNNSEVSREEWFDENYDSNWVDFVILENGKIISRAGVWMFSEDKWEVAAVSTLPQYRNKGYGVKIVSCCTDYILSRGKIATCTTHEDNVPMRNLAEKVGFKIV